MSQEGESTDTSVPELIQRPKRSRIRACYRAHTSKLLNDARDEIYSESPSILVLQKLSVFLKEKSSILRKIDEEVFLETKDDDIKNEVIQCEEIQSDISGVLVEIEDKLSGLKLENGSQSNSEISRPNISTSTNSSYVDSAAKLPKLELPKFYGDPKKWIEWWDSFETVHKSDALSPANKFRHLKLLLDGPAAKSISGIQVTGSKYGEAIEILQKSLCEPTNYH